MTDQHRATPEQWDYVDVWGVVHDCAPSSCILELRARVEALEAAQQDKLDRLIALDAADPTPDPAMTELRAASAEAQPAGELVEPSITHRELARIWNDSQNADEDSGDAMARLYRAGFLVGMKWQAKLLEQEASQ
jgi:hypothetical protein